jgi:NAD(P)-dependent dehydrogenase (short-subunit alcohol dehydrogenase family)
MESPRSPLTDRIRKIAIVLALLGLLLPVLIVNIGDKAEQAGRPKSLAKLNRPVPFLQALLLCQQWTLFSEMSPFNFKLQYEIELIDGQVVPLRDVDRENAGQWEPVFFYNESKTELNLYADSAAQRRYLEYLVRTNGIYASWIQRRTISMRYQNVLTREQSATEGRHYGPDTIFVLDTY